jgi:hypothetical protein
MGSDETTIDGADLVAGFAGLRWYEAVAVVAQLAETVRQSGTVEVPDLPHIRLSTAGAITVLPGSDYSGQPVTQLAINLKELLKGAPAVPAELTALAAQAAERSPGNQNVGDFLKSLNYFERPDRQAVLHGIVERIGSVAEDARRAREIQRLRQKARDKAMAPAPSASSKPSEKRRPKAVFAVLVVLVMMAAGATAAWWSFRPAAAGVPSRLTSVVTRAGKGIAKAIDGGVARLFGGSAGKQPSDNAAPAGSVSKPASRGAARTGQRREPNAPSAALTGTEAAADMPPLLSPNTLGTFPDPALLPVPDLAPIVLEPARTYTAADPDVTPPVPLQPMIGQVTADSAVLPGDMEVIVDTTGAVERVRLLAPSRFQDRWLIFAVKARRFTPAMVDGRPVRYRLHLRTEF